MRNRKESFCCKTGVYNVLCDDWRHYPEACKKCGWTKEIRKKRLEAIRKELREKRTEATG